MARPGVPCVSLCVCVCVCVLPPSGLCLQKCVKASSLSMTRKALTFIMTTKAAHLVDSHDPIATHLVRFKALFCSPIQSIGYDLYGENVFSNGPLIYPVLYACRAL